MKRRARRSGGFTLLEVAVALSILGAGVITCLQLFGGSLRLQERAAHESRAVLHARAVMDALLVHCRPCAGAPNCDPNDFKDYTADCPVTAEGLHTAVLLRHAGAAEGISEDALDLQSDYALRYLQVDVRWQDGLGMKTYTLKSLRIAAEVE